MRHIMYVSDSRIVVVVVVVERERETEFFLIGVIVGLLLAFSTSMKAEVC